jgi:hydroxyacylglutathione hydrolase
MRFLVLLAFATLACGCASRRLQPLPGVVGVGSGGTYVWILRTTHGAALVDAGLDVSAQPVLDELRAEGLTADDVHTILLTHGHVDHWAGALKFPRALVRAGAGDVPLIRSEQECKAWLPRTLIAWFGPKLPPPPRLVGLEGDARLDVDGEPIDAVLLPGHTPGSAAYLFRGMLFTGDSLFRSGSHRLAAANPMFTDDRALNRRSLEKLRALAFTRVADGHCGVAENARAKLAAFLSPPSTHGRAAVTMKQLESCGGGVPAFAP